ncbi:MAG: hypothetical protein R2688_04595 [Fimbriimonadaceae bacterium]
MSASTEPQREQSPKEKFLDGLRVLSSIDKTFIIAENRTNLLVIDPGTSPMSESCTKCSAEPGAVRRLNPNHS